MINYNMYRNTAVLYTCGVCNLNCRYCNIDKNPVLAEIDKQLAASFEGDYYFNRIKQYFPEKTMLRNIETWGGEPFLHMERIYPLLRKLIEFYPYFDNMYSSTNFSYPTWLDQFFGLMDIFGEYPTRYFQYTLQLSVDGPEDINDYNRGTGVTQKCLANFKKLTEALKNGRLPSNVQLVITLKGTLDLDNIRALQSKEKIIEYYQFYENNYMLPIRDLKLANAYTALSVPNTAVPSPVTVEDGKLFANFCRLCREIEQENWVNHYFQEYTVITPFANRNRGCENCVNYQGPLWGCGSGTTVIGFLPNNMVTSCHEGFTEVVDKYKQYVAERNLDNIVISFNRFIGDNKVQLTMTDEQYLEHERKMYYYLADNATAQLASSTTQIMALAMANLVDPKYLDEATARNAARYFQDNCSFCIKDNYNQTGSFTLFHNGLYKLLLNGALDYINPEGGACTTC